MNATLRQFSRAAVSIVEGDGNEEEKAGVLGNAKCLSDIVVCAAVASDGGGSAEPAEADVKGVAVAEVPEEVARAARLVAGQANEGNIAAWRAVETCVGELDPVSSHAGRATGA